MSELELTYQLAELPSAQHRAGLAGLVLMVQYLHRQPWLTPALAMMPVNYSVLKERLT